MDTSILLTFQKLGLFLLVGYIFVVPVDCQLQEINKNEMGMETLYKMVRVFLGDVVQPKNISDSFINLTTVFVDGNFDSDELTDWKKWSEYLIGFCVCIAIGLLFIVVMPIAGFIFCCCRLCGNCGGKKRPNETKRSKCKRNTFCTLLIVFNTLALAGVICAFICNSLLYKHLQNEKSDGLVGHLQNSLQHIQVFANDSVQNVSVKALQTVKDVSDDVIKKIEDTGTSAVEKALASLNATANLNKAEALSKTVNRTNEKLNDINNLLSRVSDDTMKLQNNLTSIKDDVIKAVCNTASCAVDDSEYQMEANFTKLGDLSEEVKKVSTALDMDKFINQAKESIKEAQEGVKRDVAKQTGKVSDSIETVNKSVNDGIKDLRTKKDEAVVHLNDAYKELNDADETVKDYADYIYYGGIGVCCAYLLIVVLYYIGLLFGLCGERPGDGAPCCNRRAGSNFLMAGVSFTFIFSWILMLLCLIMFMVGGLSYTEVCRYFVDHDAMDIQIFDKTLNNGLDLSGAIFKNKSAKFSISSSLKKCQDNAAVYSAFDLQNVVDLDNITRLDSFKDELDELKMETVQIPNVTILNPKLKKKLKSFADAGLSSSTFTKFIDETTKNLTNVNLLQKAEELKTLAQSNSDPGKFNSLIHSAGRLKSLAQNDIPAIETNIVELRKFLVELQKDESSFSDSITDIIQSLELSQSTFNTDKRDLIREAIDHLADNIFKSTHDSVDQLKTEIKGNIGHCQPLSDAFFSLTDSVCVLGVDTMNGLWFSFGGCLFFFILCLIFAIPLTSLYRCEHKYEKEFDDPNYVMYGGPNPDTIPLTRWPNTNPVILKYFKNLETGSQVHLVPSHDDKVTWQSFDYRKSSLVFSMERPRGQPQQQPHHSGMANSAYSPEIKPYSAPPPYRDDMREGIAAYAYPPPEYNGHQHHDLASAYPALNKSGGHPGRMDTYNYPY